MNPDLKKVLDAVESPQVDPKYKEIAREIHELIASYGPVNINQTASVLIDLISQMFIELFMSEDRASQETTLKEFARYFEYCCRFHAHEVKTQMQLKMERGESE